MSQNTKFSRIPALPLDNFGIVLYILVAKFLCLPEVRMCEVFFDPLGISKERGATDGPK